MLLKQLFPFNFSISKRIFTPLCIFSGFFVFFYFHYLYKLNFVSVSTCFYVYQSLTGNQNSFGLLKNYKFEGYTYEIIWKTKLGGKKNWEEFSPLFQHNVIQHNKAFYSWSYKEKMLIVLLDFYFQKWMTFLSTWEFGTCRIRMKRLIHQSEKNSKILFQSIVLTTSFDKDYVEIFI